MAIPNRIGPRQASRHSDGFLKISMTREQFEARLSTIESCRRLIASQALHLDPATATAVQIANQIESNMTVMVQVCDLMKETGVTVVYTDEHRAGSIPMPVKLNITQTLLNFDNDR